jgi:NADPH-dependent 2,4-dienoyl-CoA reductase/sulfur reductase-like enzyme
MKPPRCAVNPVLGREVDYQHIPAPKSRKKAVVVGGGPAGMEAARTLAGRGHEVILFEKGARLGGLLWQASGAPFKADLRKYLEWSIRMTEQCPNIDVRLSTEATPEMIAEENPDALIIAVGAAPSIPKLTCQDNSKVIWVGDLEKEDIRIGKNVLIAGAGLTGCETALKFLQAGKTVTLIDALPREKLGTGSSPINAYALFDILESLKVDLRPETRLIDVTKDYAVIKENNIEQNLAFDTVILALGRKANANYEIIRQLRDAVTESYVVGDSNDRDGALWNATTSAFDAAMAV